MGIKTSNQELLTMKNAAESLVIGVQWHTSLVGKHGREESIRLLNIDTFGN